MFCFLIIYKVVFSYYLGSFVLVGALPLGAWPREIEADVQAAVRMCTRQTIRIVAIQTGLQYLTVAHIAHPESDIHAGSQDSFLPAAFVGHRPQESKHFEFGSGLLLVTACGMMTKSALLLASNWKLLMKDTKTRCYCHCGKIKLSVLSIFAFFLLGHHPELAEVPESTLGRWPRRGVVGPEPKLTLASFAFVCTYVAHCEIMGRWRRLQSPPKHYSLNRHLT